MIEPDSENRRIGFKSSEIFQLEKVWLKSCTSPLAPPLAHGRAGAEVSTAARLRASVAAAVRGCRIAAKEVFETQGALVLVILRVRY